jgi:hypothetical protein
MIYFGVRPKNKDLDSFVKTMLSSPSLFMKTEVKETAVADGPLTYLLSS